MPKFISISPTHRPYRADASVPSQSQIAPDELHALSAALKAATEKVLDREIPYELARDYMAQVIRDPRVFHEFRSQIALNSVAPPFGDDSRPGDILALAAEGTVNALSAGYPANRFAEALGYGGGRSGIRDASRHPAAGRQRQGDPRFPRFDPSKTQLVVRTGRAGNDSAHAPAARGDLPGVGDTQPGKGTPAGDLTDGHDTAEPRDPETGGRAAPGTGGVSFNREMRELRIDFAYSLKRFETEREKTLDLLKSSGGADKVGLGQRYVDKFNHSNDNLYKAPFGPVARVREIERRIAENGGATEKDLIALKRAYGDSLWAIGQLSPLLITMDNFATIPGFDKMNFGAGSAGGKTGTPAAPVAAPPVEFFVCKDGSSVSGPPGSAALQCQDRQGSNNPND